MAAGHGRNWGCGAVTGCYGPLLLGTREVQGALAPAVEVCDGMDDDCDGETDETFRFEDMAIGEACHLIRRGDAAIGLEDLRGLLAAVRSAGEKGLQITRFKGLGEMNAEQLWETTMNPDTRRLLPVALGPVDAAGTVLRFTMLMGKGEAAARRAWMERSGDTVEADV